MTQCTKLRTKVRFGVTCENPAVDCLEVSLWCERDVSADEIAALAVARATSLAESYGVRLSGNAWIPPPDAIRQKGIRR